MENVGLKRAHEKVREMRAAGLEPAAPMNAIEKAKADPKSRAKAVRAYWWQHEGVLENRGNPEGGIQRRIAEEHFEASRSEAKQSGWKAVVNAICWECVCGRIDPGPKRRIRDCMVPKCGIHPVRPFQAYVGRGKHTKPENRRSRSTKRPLPTSSSAI